MNGNSKGHNTKDITQIYTIRKKKLKLKLYCGHCSSGLTTAYKDHLTFVILLIRIGSNVLNFGAMVLWCIHSTKLKTMCNSRFPQCQALERGPVCDYFNSEDRNCIYVCNAAFTKPFGHGILFNAVIICKTYMFRGLSFTKW